MAQALVSFKTQLELPKLGLVDVKIYTDYSYKDKLFKVFAWDGKHKRMQVGREAYATQAEASKALETLAAKIEQKGV